MTCPQARERLVYKQEMTVVHFKSSIGVMHRSLGISRGIWLWWFNVFWCSRRHIISQDSDKEYQLPDKLSYTSEGVGIVCNLSQGLRQLQDKAATSPDGIPPVSKKTQMVAYFSRQGNSFSLSRLLFSFLSSLLMSPLCLFWMAVLLMTGISYICKASLCTCLHMHICLCGHLCLFLCMYEYIVLCLCGCVSLFSFVCIHDKKWKKSRSTKPRKWWLRESS